MPTPEEQILELLCSTDGETSGLVAMLHDACFPKINLPTFIPMLMSGLSHDEKLDLVEELRGEKQLLESEKIKPPEEPKTMLEITSIDNSGLFNFRFNRGALDVRQFVILACTLVEAGAECFNASVEDVWAMLDAERHNPEPLSQPMFTRLIDD